MFSRLPLLDPVLKGVISAVVSVALATLGAYLFLKGLPSASPQLLENMALIGGSFVIAYAIEAVWLVPRIEVDEDHEEWLGFITGVGMLGLLGIAAALLTAEHRAAGHNNTLDDVGLAFAAISLLISGGVLILQPYLANRYRDDSGLTG